jgi:hypothetical protein
LRDALRIATQLRNLAGECIELAEFAHDEQIRSEYLLLTAGYLRMAEAAIEIAGATSRFVADRCSHVRRGDHAEHPTPGVKTYRSFARQMQHQHGSKNRVTGSDRPCSQLGSPAYRQSPL